MKFRNRHLGLMAVGGALGALWATRTISRRVQRVELKDKVVLITGGSRGLGFAMAEQFGRRGARLAICARNPEPLERARRELEQQGIEVLAEECDIADLQQVERLVDDTTRRFGGVDVLVNNAGIIAVGPLEVQRREDFEQAMNVMFWAL